MRKIKFVKYTAQGNDFILIDSFQNELKFNYKNFAKKICDRNFGVGADGLLVLKKNKLFDFEMLYYNSDGSCGMCGNGARSISDFYFRNYTKKNKATFFVFDKIYTSEKIGNQISVLFSFSEIPKIENHKIKIENKIFPIHYINLGFSPHTIIFWKDIKKYFKNISFENFNVNYFGKIVRDNKFFFFKWNQCWFCRKKI